MRMAYSAMFGVMSAVVRSEVKNALMMESVLEVSGPFHSSQVGYDSRLVNDIERPQIGDGVFFVLCTGRRGGGGFVGQ